MKTYVLLFFLLLLSLLNKLDAQNISWSSKKDFSYRTWVKKICADQNGNIYSLSTFERDYNNSSSKSGFAISKQDSLGNVLWEKIIYNNVAYTNGYDLACNPSGDLFLIASTGDSVHIDGATIYGKDGISFFLKFNPTGNLQFINQYNAENYSLALDVNGNCFITGFLIGATNFGSFQVDNTSDSSPDAGVFVAKYSGAGLALSVQTYGSWLAHGKIIKIADDGSRIICGTFNDNTCPLGTTTFTKNNGMTFAFKTDSNGTVLWAKQLNSMVAIKGCVIEHNSNVALAGEFYGSVVFDSKTLSAINNVDIFVAHYSSTGNLINARQFTGPGNDNCNAININSNNEYMLACSTPNTVTYDTSVICASGMQDYFLAIVDTALTIKSVIKQQSSSNGANAIYDVNSPRPGFIVFGGCFTNDLFLGISHYQAAGLPKGFLCHYNMPLFAAGIIKTEIPASDFDVYPNPSSGQCQMCFKGKEQGLLQLNIFDSGGQLMHRQSAMKNAEDYRLMLDLSKFPSGVYFIEAIIDRKKYTRQLVIH